MQSKPVFSLISVEGLTRRSVQVTVRLLSRPEKLHDWEEFYGQFAHEYAFAHDAHVVGPIEVEPRPFSDVSYVTFTMKRWKHPEKHHTAIEFLHSQQALIG